jgi:hypothetical protein
MRQECHKKQIKKIKKKKTSEKNNTITMNNFVFLLYMKK